MYFLRISRYPAAKGKNGSKILQRSVSLLYEIYLFFCKRVRISLNRSLKTMDNVNSMFQRTPEIAIYLVMRGVTKIK